jgi:hypothetical protein
MLLPRAFEPGTHLVGVDIAPGTYRNRVPASMGYWARLSGLGGTVDQIIANDNFDGFAVVTIAPTDVAFTSQRCGIWSPDLSAVTSMQTAFDDGTFVVGVDMRPGRYRSRAAAGDMGYWARLSGFGGTLDQIIANDNFEGTAIVDIMPGDGGFKSSRCGGWTLVG